MKEFYWITQENKGIIGNMDDSGIVTFAVEAGDGSTIRGTEFFNAMMRFFGNDVRGIHGVWIKGPRGLASANIDRVNELTASGMTLEEAITRAWTVTRARKLGFDKVGLYEQPSGKSGAYTRIDVFIERGP